MSDMPENLFRSARVVKDASLLYDPMPQKDVSLPPTRTAAPLTPAEARDRCREVEVLVKAALEVQAMHQRYTDRVGAADGWARSVEASINSALTPFIKGD